MHRILIGLTLFLVFCLIPGSPASADLGVNEALLTSPGAVNEINLGGDGLLYVSDWTAGQVWVVNPVTAEYTRYTSAALAGVTDARPAAGGRIWFTDAATVFGAIDPATGKVITWDIDDGQSDFSLSGVAFDAAGNVWITEAVLTTAKLRRFNPLTLDLCVYTFSGGTDSDYLVYYDGFLWFANWYRDRIYRFNPNDYGVTYWPIPAGRATGLTFDADGNLWWADATTTAPRLRRLAPSAPPSNAVRSYTLPVGTAPRMVAAGGGLILFSEYAGAGYTVGRVGVLSPEAAAYVTTSSTPVGLGAATESCSPLAAGKETAFTIDSGDLDTMWSAATWTTVADANGWTVYQAPAGAKPWGVALAGSYAWIADEGRQVLARTARTEALGAPAVTIEAIQPDVVLSWDAVPGAASYEVCIDATPYFTPGDANCLPESTDLSYPHPGVLADTTNYYYYVRSLAGAQTSPVSNHVAKFAFSLTPGN